MPDNNGVQYTNPPQSRNEAIVEAIIEGTEYTDPPQSENEEILVSILNETPYEKPPTSRMADLLIKLKDFIEDGPGPTPPTPVRPVVPQTGTWQFKTTPATGFLIIGQDDDTVDAAQFGRMVNGYGYPVVRNSEPQYANHTFLSDADNVDIPYPSGSVSAFPNGGKIEDLNKYYIAHPELGEVALHDNGEGQTWNSDKLTGDKLDAYYATYTAGGGTKTKEELRTAIMTKYASTDIAQGASRVGSQRTALEQSIGDFVYTIGKWGGHDDWEIDGISIGTEESVSQATATNYWSRTQNFMGDGYLAWNGSIEQQSPWHIWRDSTGMSAQNASSDCQLAYDNQICVEIFGHYFLKTPQNFANFKDTLDTIKSYVDAGKIRVVTRKQYYELGEFVEHPITGLSLTADAVAYAVGSTITASNFTCKAILDNGTEVTCESDKILDLSAIDTSTEGSYTVSLRYRGKKTTTTVKIMTVVPTNFLLVNGSYSGTIPSGLDNIGELEESISLEQDKTYKLEFDFTCPTTTNYSTHYIRFKIGNYLASWFDSTEAQINTVTGTTSGHAEIEFTPKINKTLTYLTYVSAKLNTSFTGDYSIANACIYEVPSE